MAVVTTEFSPEQLTGAQDPYALLRDVRAEGAVVRAGGSWLVTRYREANTVLCSAKSSTAFIGEMYRSVLPPGAAREEMSHRINFLDAADHARVRKLVSKAFTPRRINQLRPHITGICRELLDPLAGDGPVDLIRAFTHQLPSLVISELLGVPAQDRDRLTVLADRVAGLLGLRTRNQAVLDDAIDAAEEMHAYLRALVEKRRAAPRDDLISALIATEDDGHTLSESELLSLAATLYSAGHRTTRDLFSNGLSVFLSDADLVDAFKAGAVPTAAVVEEFLRFETPTHYVGRMLLEPLRVGDVEIPAGEPIAVLLASANRDETVYEHAEVFDPKRWMADPPPESPLSFAIGPNYCLGANLARLEAAVMLETLFAVFPHIRLSGEPLTFWHTGLFRGLEELSVIPGSAELT